MLWLFGERCFSIAQFPLLYSARPLSHFVGNVNSNSGFKVSFVQRITKLKYALSLSLSVCGMWTLVSLYEWSTILGNEFLFVFI